MATPTLLTSFARQSLSYGRQMWYSSETTSNGTIYVFGTLAGGSYSNGLYIWKSTDDGASFTSLTYVSDQTMFGNSGWGFGTAVDTALDSSGYIHVICIRSAYFYTTGRDLVYALFNTANETWGSWAEAASISGNGAGYGEPVTFPPPVLRLDSSDKPHIFYRWSYDTGELRYTNKTGASWLAAETVKDVGINPDALIVSGTTVNAFYESYITSAYYANLRVRTTSWGSESAYTTANASHPGVHAIIANSSGTIYRYTFLDGADGSDAYFYENDSLALTLTGRGNGGTWTRFAAGVVNNNIRVLVWYDTNAQEIRYSCTNGSTIPWTTPRTLVSNIPAIYDIFTEYSFFNKNENTYINLIYVVNTTTLYGYFLQFEPDYYIRSSKSAYMNGHANPLLPASDVTIGDWKNESSGTTLYPSLADSSTSTYVWQDNVIPRQYFEVALAAPEGTVDTTSQHVLSWQGYLKTGTLTTTVTIELRQGSTIIATEEKVLTSSIVEYNHVLTPAEVSSITNYSDLRIRVYVSNVS